MRLLIVRNRGHARHLHDKAAFAQELRRFAGDLSINHDRGQRAIGPAAMIASVSIAKGI
jgi:hypothetical protein